MLEIAILYFTHRLHSHTDINTKFNLEGGKTHCLLITMNILLLASEQRTAQYILI